MGKHAHFAASLNERLQARYDADVVATHEKQHTAGITAAEHGVEPVMNSLVFGLDI
jgi:hypothetical protein